MFIADPGVCKPTCGHRVPAHLCESSRIIRIHKEYKLAKLGRVEKSVDIIIRAKIMLSRTDVTL